MTAEATRAIGSEQLPREVGRGILVPIATVAAGRVTAGVIVRGAPGWALNPVLRVRAITAEKGALVAVGVQRAALVYVVIGVLWRVKGRCAAAEQPR